MSSCVGHSESKTCALGFRLKPRGFKGKEQKLAVLDSPVKPRGFKSNPRLQVFVPVTSFCSCEATRLHHKIRECKFLLLRPQWPHLKPNWLQFLEFLNRCRRPLFWLMAPPWVGDCTVVLAVYHICPYLMYVEWFKWSDLAISSSDFVMHNSGLSKISSLHSRQFSTARAYHCLTAP